MDAETAKDEKKISRGHQQLQDFSLLESAHDAADTNSEEQQANGKLKEWLFKNLMECPLLNQMSDD